MPDIDMRPYLTTAKQQDFDYDFCAAAEEYDVWDEVEVGKEYTAARTFHVEREDLLEYARSIDAGASLFRDEAGDQLIAHPLILVQIGFYCIDKGPGSWIRTPGAMNPGQVIEYHDDIRVGETIVVKMLAYDKWIRRDKHYLTYQVEYVTEEGQPKATWWTTLILPPTREDVMWYANAGKGEVL